MALGLEFFRIPLGCFLDFLFAPESKLCSDAAAAADISDIIISQMGLDHCEILRQRRQRWPNNDLTTILACKKEVCSTVIVTNVRSMKFNFAGGNECRL